MKLPKPQPRDAATNGGRFFLIVLSIITTLLGLFYGRLALISNHNFLMISCDTALLQNAMVNTLHGHWFRDTVYAGPSVLGIHSTFVIALFAPLYWIVNSPDFFLVLQAFAIYSAVIPFFLFAHDVLKDARWAFFLALTFLTAPLLFLMTAAPLHFETFILPAVWWSAWFYRTRRPVAFGVSMLFAFSCGEQAAPIYAGLGLALLVWKDGLPWRKRFAVGALAGGLGWMVFCAGILFPLMRHPEQANVYAIKYEGWNATSAPELMRAIVSEPARALGLLISPVRWHMLLLITGMALVMTFTSWSSLMLLAPAPFYLWMSDQEFSLSIHGYYYQFAVIAGYWGLLLLFIRMKKNSWRTVLLVWVVGFNFFVLTGMVPTYVMSLHTPRQPVNEELRRLFATIPRHAGVYGQHRYSAYLSARPNFVMGDLREENFDLEKTLAARFATTKVSADQIDFIVCDMATDQCGPDGGNPDEFAVPRRWMNIDRLLRSRKWRFFGERGDVFVLERVR